jgi:hypothetical protein
VPDVDRSGRTVDHVVELHPGARVEGIRAQVDPVVFGVPVPTTWWRHSGQQRGIMEPSTSIGPSIHSSHSIPTESTGTVPPAARTGASSRTTAAPLADQDLDRCQYAGVSVHQRPPLC